MFVGPRPVFSVTYEGVFIMLTSNGNVCSKGVVLAV